MSLAAGSRLGPYEIVAALGAGGMGEVYRAHDPKLGRDVAIKILPDAFALDAERLARFEREARTLASLNHPNIAHIYGFGDEDLRGPVLDTREGSARGASEHEGASEGSASGAGGPSHAIYLVMELVEGEDLSTRLTRGAIPVDETIEIAKQMALGLEAAHERGIIHRDLKPANIKVRPDGSVKVLDFGLAKAAAANGSSAQLSMSPTITTPAQMTGTGVVLGTAAYMSPEQAKGRAVDKRADVWAFGAVLYEMLTGRRLFEGDDVSDTFAAILRAEPDWHALPSATPPALRRLLKRSLEKDVRVRLSDMAMARVELRDAEVESREAPAAVAQAAVVLKKRSVLRRLAPYVAAVLLALLTGTIAWFARRPVEPTRPIVRVSLDLGANIQLSATGRNVVAISPDASHIVYVANQRLYLRALDQFDAVPIPGTEVGGAGAHARAPAFSPDGQWIVYWQQNQLKKIPTSGGTPVTISRSSPFPVSISWDTDDDIILARAAAGVKRIQASGGAEEELVKAPGKEGLYSAQLLPGGQWILFSVMPADSRSFDDGKIVVQSRTTGERRVLIEPAREARYVSSGHLVFSRGNALMAQAFDLHTLKLSGPVVPVMDDVSNSADVTPAAHYAVSKTGTAVFVPTAATSDLRTSVSRFVLMTRDGHASTLFADLPGATWYPRFSPDGSRIAYGFSANVVDLANKADLWVLETARGARTRVTFDANNRYYPIWTRDGARLTFADGTGATNRVLMARADGTGGTETLIDVSDRKFPTSWSPDGRVLALYGGGNNTFSQSSRDIWILRMDGDKKPVPFIETAFEERGAIFSPNGAWLAYVSNKAGQNDVYVRPYPGPGREQTVSVGGGQEPVWGPSGKELFYRHNGQMWVVRVDERSGTLAFSSPSRMFADPYRLDTGGANGGMANYDVSPDGRTFVMIENVPPAEPSKVENVHLQVVVNWLAELERRVPAMPAR